MISDTLAALLRQDAAIFLAKVIASLTGLGPAEQPPYLRLFACYLQQLATGEVRRLIVNAPPRTYKSTAFSRALIAWLVGREPSLRVLLVSHSRELSSEILRSTRTLMEEEWYKAAFPSVRLSKEKNTEHEVERVGLSPPQATVASRAAAPIF